MLNLDNLSPMAAGRVRLALDKRYNFSGAGVMTLEQFMARHADTAAKRIGNGFHKYDRRKFNRMTGPEQRAYEARLARPEYWFCYGDGYSLSIPKIVFDCLTVRELEPVRA